MTTTPKRTRFDPNVQSSRPLSPTERLAFDRFDADASSVCSFCRRRHAGPCQRTMDYLGSAFQETYKDEHNRYVSRDGVNIEFPHRHLERVFQIDGHASSSPSSDPYSRSYRSSPPPERVWRPSGSSAPGGGWNSQPYWGAGSAPTPVYDYSRPSMTIPSRPASTYQTLPSNYTPYGSAPTYTQYSSPPYTSSSSLPSNSYPLYTPTDNILGNVCSPTRSAPINIPSHNRNDPFVQACYVGQYTPISTSSPTYGASSQFPEITSNGIFSERLPTFNSPAFDRNTSSLPYEYQSSPSQPWTSPSNSSWPYQPQSYTPFYNPGSPTYRPY